MGVSVSGVLTLLGVVFAGPLIWMTYSLVLKLRGGTQKAYVVSRVAKSSSGPTGTKNALTPRVQLRSSDYLLTLIGYAIGIGNVWRFPYIISQNGGSAAVVAYLLCTVFVSIPLFLMELIIGQHTRQSTIKCYNMIRPKWRGLGFAQAALLMCVLTYYQILLAYSSIYLLNSVYDPLPWSYEASHINTTTMLGNTSSDSCQPYLVDDTTIRGPAEEFWYTNVLSECTDDADCTGMGVVHWPLAVALLFVWSICFFSIAFGQDVLSKVTWFTVLGPLVLMFVLLIRAVTLDGAIDGIKYYIGKFHAEELLHADVWVGACSQVIFSLSPGFGTAITMSSLTKRNEDVFRVCFIVAIVNSLFSIIGGFAIFSIVGNIAFCTGRTAAGVASQSGTGLAFITIAEGITYFGAAANAMSVLFFTMLLMLGLASSFAWCQTIVAIVGDTTRDSNWPVRHSQIVAGVCTILFLFGLPFCTQKGGELLETVDHFVGTLALLLGCFVEAMMFNFDVGWERLALALKQATVGNKRTPSGRNLWPLPFWRLCLHVTAPMATLALAVYVFAQDVEDSPNSIEGWTLFGLLVVIGVSTLWDFSKGTLTSLAEIQKRIEQNFTNKAPMSYSDDMGELPAYTYEDVGIQLTSL